MSLPMLGFLRGVCKSYEPSISALVLQVSEEELDWESEDVSSTISSRGLWEFVPLPWVETQDRAWGNDFPRVSPDLKCMEFVVWKLAFKDWRGMKATPQLIFEAWLKYAANSGKFAPIEPQGMVHLRPLPWVVPIAQWLGPLWMWFTSEAYLAY